MRALFLVDMAAMPTAGWAQALAGMGRALQEQFPAFTVGAVALADDYAAVVVRAVEGTPPAAVARLDGWGHGRLTLCAVLKETPQGCIASLR